MQVSKSLRFSGHPRLISKSSVIVVRDGDVVEKRAVVVVHGGGVVFKRAIVVTGVVVVYGSSVVAERAVVIVFGVVIIHGGGAVANRAVVVARVVVVYGSRDVAERVVGIVVGVVVVHGSGVVAKRTVVSVGVVIGHSIVVLLMSTRYWVFRKNRPLLCEKIAKERRCRGSGDRHLYRRRCPRRQRNVCVGDVLFIRIRWRRNIRNLLRLVQRIRHDLVGKRRGIIIYVWVGRINIFTTTFSFLFLDKHSLQFVPDCHFSVFRHFTQVRQQAHQEVIIVILILACAIVVTLRLGRGRNIDVLYVLPLEVRVFVEPDWSPLQGNRNSYYVIAFTDSTDSLLAVQAVQALRTCDFLVIVDFS